ncbi:hypothetical protein [Cohnella yongneupensis]|uniref:Uncharacterized protein n=1 Tax=Cohnella yongneupensis TaxID=425006 RepID=A0ABW0R287_9BACL
MERHLWLEWLKPAFDQRFNELANVIGKCDAGRAYHHQQRDIEQRLKEELTNNQYQIILEWEEALNYRNAVEKEAMYMAGVRDGMRLVKQLHDWISE